MLNLLRLHEGFTEAAFQARTGLTMRAISTPLERAIARGWLEHTGTRIRPTALGQRYLNNVLELFLENTGD